MMNDPSNHQRPQEQNRHANDSSDLGKEPNAEDTSLETDPLELDVHPDEPVNQEADALATQQVNKPTYAQNEGDVPDKENFPVLPKKTKSIKRKLIESPGLSRSLRPRKMLKAPKRFQDFEVYNVSCNENTTTIQEPSNYSVALKSAESVSWSLTIQEELAAHNKTETWAIVDVKEGMNVIDTKWTFALKYDSSGKVNRFKARLCARDLLQEYGKDYNETYAPVDSYEAL